MKQFVLAVKSADAAGATLVDNSKLREELIKIEETNSWLTELRDQESPTRKTKKKKSHRKKTIIYINQKNKEIERGVGEEKRRLEAVQATEREITDRMKLFSLSAKRVFS